MKKLGQFGAIAVVLSALLWSVDGLLRIHLQLSMSAPAIVFWEHVLGALLLAPAVLFSFKAFKQLTRKQWLAITGVSFLSGAVGTILYTAALGRTNFIPFSVVVLLQQLNPIFAITTAALLLRERLSKRFIGLSLVALVAAYFLWLPGGAVNFSTGNGTLIGGLMALGAAAAWGTSTAFSKYALQNTSTLHVTALRFSITPLFALPFIAFSSNATSAFSLTFDQFKYLVAITFSTGLVALLIYYWGLKRVTASHAAILELAWPASAVLVGWIWQHKGLSISQAIAAIAMTAAIYAIVQDSKNDSVEKTKPTRAVKPKAKLATS